MGLTLPTVSTTRSYGTFAQDWASYVSGNFFIIDSHDHTKNRGNQIAWANLLPSGLSMNQFSVKNLSYLSTSEVVESDQPAIPINSLWTDSVDLWWRNSTGFDVRITEDGGLPIDTTGGFFGDYGDDGSKASFVGDTSSFFFFGADSAVYADIAASSLTANTFTVNALESLVVATGTGTFGGLSGYAPDIQNNSWEKWYDTNQPKTGVIYPYIAKRDKNQGVKLNKSVSYNDTWGAKGLAFKSYYNNSDIAPFKLKYKCYFSEIPSFGGGWQFVGSGDTFYVTKSFQIEEVLSTNGSVGDTCVFARSLFLYADAPSGSKIVYSPVYTYSESFSEGITTVTITFHSAKTDALPTDSSPYIVVYLTGSTYHYILPQVVLCGLVRENI